MTAYEDLAEYDASLRARGVKDNRMSYLRRLREATGKPLLDLSAREINEWIAGLAIAPKTQQGVVSYVKNALKYLNGGDFPPVCKQIAHRKGKTLIPRVKSARELLTEGEVEGLIAATPRTDLKALIALHIATGARPAEVLTLDWEDFEFASVNGTSVVRVSIRETKTQSPRTIVTPNERAIRYLKEWQKSGNGTGPVWTFQKPNTYWKYLKRLAKKAGIAKNVYPQLFRHMRGAELYDAPPNARDNQMGWTPGSNMYANYTHLRPDEVEDVIIEREGGTPDPFAESLAEMRNMMVGIAQNPDVEELLSSVFDLLVQTLISSPEALEQLREAQEKFQKTDPTLAEEIVAASAEEWEADIAKARRKS